MVVAFAKLEVRLAISVFFLTSVPEKGSNVFMFLDFFQSLKYVNHLYPIAFLRIFLGYYYLQQALFKLSSDFLTRPKFAESVMEWLPQSQAFDWYKMFIIQKLVPHWQSFGFAVVGIEFAIAISFLIGYVVRPTALLAALFCFNMIYLSSPQNEQLYKAFIAIHLTLAWVGAGRCLGVDYYFFKRRRGVWW